MSETTNKVKGRVKQAAGALTGDKELKREGERDELKGKVEGAVKDLKHAIKKVLK